MKKIYLIRHGKTVWNEENRLQGSKDSALTSEGKSQALYLSEWFQDIKIDRIFCSPAPRAQKTASLAFPNYEKTTDARIREIDMGEWEGQLYSDISKKDPQQWHNFFYNPLDYKPNNGGESYFELEKRLMSFINTLEKETQDDGIIVVVSHHIAIKVLYQLLINKNIDKVGDTPEILPNSVTVIDRNQEKYVMNKFSCIDHYKYKIYD